MKLSNCKWCGSPELTFRENYDHESDPSPEFNTIGDVHMCDNCNTTHGFEDGKEFMVIGDFKKTKEVVPGDWKVLYGGTKEEAV